ncbi:DNA damage-binding protein 1 [Sporormia fimetaria CBS 119925]|uniref:DNA damage-binding protein 1 n=1 Tax=Sporormia fimetaria CBS 119925 TaxID=1340428 RepID=A0A6A6V2Q4_9PLEO|nr:DNA damage-binding protein 1 [Sporormia fimetaria CBS 119925]
MAYIAPIHRASSVRHALKLNLMSTNEECLVVAKANRLEIYIQKEDDLALCHSQLLYGKVTILQKLRPAPATTDHLFVGTDRFEYFTLSWSRDRKQLQTENVFKGVADNAARESQTGERCHVDPTGKFMTLEVYEGIVTIIPLVQRGKKRKHEFETPHLGEAQPARISEMFVRSSAFLAPNSQDDKPKLALLHEHGSARVKLKIRELSFSGPDGVELSEGELARGDLELGASHLIPVDAPASGLIILGETSIGYYNDNTGEVTTEPLREATIFVAWARVDKARYVLADDYGRLYLFMLVFNDQDQVQSWRLDNVGKTSRASVLAHLDAGLVFVGSHQGDSQVVKISEKALEVTQTLSNIAPVLDFTIMDMGNRSGEGQASEYSSGQARVVTGSGAYQDGSLRSVRSGVRLEEIGVLGEMDHIIDLFDLKSSAMATRPDTLLATFVTQSRVFRFDGEGDVEELEDFAGLSLSENTLVASNVSQGRLLQITPSRVQLSDLDSGMIVSEWQPPRGKPITAGATNGDTVLVSLGGILLVTLHVDGGLNVAKQKEYSPEDQVACVALPPGYGSTCLLGFWKQSRLSICSLESLEPITTVQIPGESVPRSLLLTQIFPEQPPTLFAAMADGTVVTYSLDTSTHELSGRKSMVLGSQQPTFRALPRANGLSSVFATCEHSSLIYGSDRRLIYSAVTAEDAVAICPFDTEAYPGSVAVATRGDLRLAVIDTDRTTHVQTLKVDETVRRIAYSPTLKAFGLGTIKRLLKGGEEILISRFKLVDEIQFKELDTYELKEGELVETVLRCTLPDGPSSVAERFVVGTAYLDDQGATAERGRIIILEVTEDRVLKPVTELAVKGGCRCLAVCDGKLVAALIKTVVVYNLEFQSESRPQLVKAAAFRCSTAPIDMTVNGSLITIADLMKSAVIVEYRPGKAGLPDKIVEVARHFRTAWATAIAEVGANTYLESDAEGNLLVLARDLQGVTEDDRRRLTVSSEMSLGEMVNRIRPVDVATASDAVVIPKAFLATVEGSIYLFGLISPSYQNLLITLQSNLADLVSAPGDSSFNEYRAFQSAVRRAEEPERFVDADLVERFLDQTEDIQRKAVEGLEADVETIRGIVEGLRRMH